MSMPVTEVERPQGFWIDLSGLQFQEDGKLTWMQAFPIGRYEHPLYGVIDITPQKVADFVKNFNDAVRGTELDIDYDHKDYSGKAAGWIKAAEDRGADGLWIAVQWTAPARQALADGEYKYFSPEFADTWKHPKTGVTYHNVLFGGAITNRPFLKDILPINLSDLNGGQFQPTGGSGVDRATLEAIARRLQVQFSEEISDDDLAKLIAEAPEPPGGEGNGDGDGSNDGGEGAGNGQSSSTSPVNASEPDADLKKLAENNPALKRILEEREEDRKRLAALEATNRLAEASTRLSDIQVKNGRFAPFVLTEARDVVASAPKALGDKVVAILQAFAKGEGLIELSESPSHRTGGGAGSTASKRFMDKIQERMKADDNLTFADASVLVAGDDPELYDMYCTEQAEGVTL